MSNRDTLLITGDKLNEITSHAQEQTITRILDLMKAKRDVYFHQSLVAGSATFWKNKVTTIENLIKEIEELKCQTHN